MDAGDHDVFCLGIAQVEYVVDHLFFIRLDGTVFMADTDQSPEIVFCHALVFGVDIHTEKEEESHDNPVDDEDKRGQDKHAETDERGKK